MSRDFMEKICRGVRRINGYSSYSDAYRKVIISDKMKELFDFELNFELKCWEYLNRGFSWSCIPIKVQIDCK